MHNPKSFLCLAFGASSLKAAEFDLNEAGALRLRTWTVQPLAPPGAQDAFGKGLFPRCLQELLAGKAFTAKRGSACVPGAHVFSKVIRLPPADAAKVARIMQFEARQNVPFPLEEAVWDYQVLGSHPEAGLEVLFVAAKAGMVESVFQAAEGVDLRLELVDAAPAALANAFRYNYADPSGCTLLLDIGAKTSQVLLLEKDRLFSRTLNLGGNSITQEFAAEARLSAAEAERFKVAEGFVGLGGAYAEPASPRQAAVAKVARQVMTRLHVQVNQTVQFYRSQHGGAAPERLLLAGGAATMPCLAQFFAEKLNLPVEYFNPFRNVSLGAEVNLEELAKVAHSLGEVVGLGLRDSARCPVELDLIPKGIRKRQMLRRKRPCLMAALCGLVAVIIGMGCFFDRSAALKQQLLNERAPRLIHLRQKAKKLWLALNRKNAAQRTADHYTGWMRARFHWADILVDLRRALAATEASMHRPGLRANIWIEKLAAEGIEEPPEQLEEESAPPLIMPPWWWQRYGRYRGYQWVPDQGAAQAPLAGGPASAKSASASTNTNEISVINLTCRAVSWRHFRAAADAELALAFLRQLQASPYSLNGTNGTQLTGLTGRDEATGTFSFEAKFKLKKPLKLVL